MFDHNTTSITEAIWFLLVKTRWKWQKWEIIEKNNKKFFLELFPIWRHPRKDVVQSSPNTYFKKRWFLLAKTTWKWQKVKNYWKKWKKVNMKSSVKGCSSGLSYHLLLTIFLEQLCNSQKIRLWKFQVNLVSSFGGILKKLEG